MTEKKICTSDDKELHRCDGEHVDVETGVAVIEHQETVDGELGVVMTEHLLALLVPIFVQKLRIVPKPRSQS